MVQYFTNIYEAISSTFVGMGITIKHIWTKPVTLQYPDERQVLPDRFRGFVHNDTAKCDACNICAKACPVDCIYIETEGKGKDRYMTRYAIDYNKCIWCSLCTENCHTDSITMSHDYDHSVYLRDSLVYEFMDPAAPIPCHRVTRVDQGFWVEPKAEKPAKPAAAKPVVETPAVETPAVEEPAVEEPAKDDGTADDKGETK